MSKINPPMFHKQIPKHITHSLIQICSRLASNRPQSKVASTSQTDAYNEIYAVFKYITYTICKTKYALSSKLAIYHIKILKYRLNMIWKITWFKLRFDQPDVQDKKDWWAILYISMALDHWKLKQFTVNLLIGTGSSRYILLLWQQTR